MKALLILSAGALASTMLVAPADAQPWRPNAAGITLQTLVEPAQYGPRRCRIIRRWDDGELVTIRRCPTPYYGRRYYRRDWDGPPRFYRGWDRPRYRERFDNGWND
jgi:hypothetical protein